MAANEHVSPFLDEEMWIDENEYAAALRDKYPVSRGHTLIVPKRVVASIFELSGPELKGCWSLVEVQKSRIMERFRPDGFNIGTNIGKAAGQTVSHAHIHLIPRYSGDHPNPRGGVRAVIPGKADY
jgi:diadenosine tetraphosphate (Ap4A) HIT family hydrolase